MKFILMGDDHLQAKSQLHGKEDVNTEYARSLKQPCNFIYLITVVCG